MMRISKLFTGLVFSLMFGSVAIAQGAFNDGSRADPYGDFGDYDNNYFGNTGNDQNGGLDDYYYENGQSDDFGGYYHDFGSQSGGLDDYYDNGNDFSNVPTAGHSATCCHP